MQRVIQAVLFAAFAVLLVSTTGAQDEPVKIGLVDVAQAVNSTEEGKAAREEYSRKEQDARAQLEPMMKQRENLNEELKSKKYVLSEDAYFQKQVEMAELENKIKTRIDETKRSLELEQGKLMKPLIDKLRAAIESVGKDQGFTIIMDRNDQSLLYAREALDITDLVVARFNKKE